MVTYVLAKKKNPKTMGYSKVPYPKSSGLPSISIIVEQQGNISVQRKIRYSEGERSIYVDEQSAGAKATVSDLVFKDGILNVDPENKPNLKRYIDLLHTNGSNKNRNKKMPVKFFEFDIDAKFREANAQEENKGNILMEYMSLSLDKKRALSHYMGKPTLNKSPDRWVYELLKTIQSSEKSMNQFLSDLQNPILDRIEVISIGEEMGLLEYSEHKWKMNGNVILSSDRTQRDKQYYELANFLIDNPETWANVRDKVKGRTKEMTTTAKAETIEKVAEKALSMDEAEELFIKAKEEKAVVFKMGKGFAISGSDNYFGKSKVDAITEIKESESLRKAINKLL